MSRFLQRFLPQPSATEMDDRQFIRERILTIVLMGAALLGVFAYIYNAFYAFQQKNWGWIIIYSVAFGWVCAIAFVRKIPYTVRTLSMLVVLFALGIVSAVQFGAAGDSRIWFFGAVILAGIFMGLRVGIISLVLTTVTYLAIGWFTSNGILPMPNPSSTLEPDNIAGWSSTAIPYFVISFMLVSSIGVLVNSLNSVIKQSRDLAKALDEDRKQLAIRSETLEHRELQIRTASEISRAAAAELDPATLFQRVSDLIRKAYNLYYVGVFTTDESSQFAVLRAGTGEAGRRMVINNHKLPINQSSIIGNAIINQKPQITGDITLDSFYLRNPELPRTRSELALPIISANHVIGAITIQSMAPDAFEENDILALQGVADSLATALENAILFQQAQKSLEEVRELHRQYLLESWENVTSRDQDLGYTYEKGSTDEGIRTTLPQQSQLEVPLVLRDQTIGQLNVETDRPTITPQEKAFIEAVTQQTAQALENIRLVEETQRNAQQDRVISTISEKLSLAMDVDNVLKIAIQELGRLPNVTEVSVHIEPDKQ